MGWLQTSVRCLSVRCPSRGHISKTKQDRPIVTMQHSTDSVAAFRSSLRRPYGDILTSDENIQNIQILVRSPDQQSSIIVTPQALSTVENRVRRSESVVNNCRPLCLQHLWYDAKVEQEAGQLLFAVAIFVFIHLLPPTKEEVNAIGRVCLSVCQQDYSKTRGWIWMKCCVSTDVGTWTNWLTFEPDPDHSPKNLKSVWNLKLVKQAPHWEQATGHGMHCREILFTL